MIATAVAVPLTQGLVALVDQEDYDRVAAFKWAASRTKEGFTWYGQRSVWTGSGYRTVLLHRFILDAPSGRQVDHINGDGLDNRRANLRLATGSQNAANRVRLTTNTSGFRGITWMPKRGKWQVALKHHGRNVFLGLFDDKIAAARAYDRGAAATWGPFARLNFPEVVS